MKIEIKCRFSAKFIFAHDAENNTMKLTLEAAVKAGAYLAGANLARANLAGANLARAYLARANLDGAYLAGANLAGANLAGANLARANLDGAYLAGAYLAGANLAGANLARANLDGAYLAGANLDGAYLAGAYLAGANLARANLDGAYLAGAYLARANLDDKSQLIGERPIFQIGPIGSRFGYFVAYLTDKGLRLRAGCFFGTKDEFEEKLAAQHAGNVHCIEYTAAMELICAHAELWTPKDDDSDCERKAK